MSKFISKTEHDLVVFRLEQDLLWYKRKYDDLIAAKKTINIVLAVDKCMDSKDVLRYKKHEMIHKIAELIATEIDDSSYVISSDEFKKYYRLRFTILSDKGSGDA